MAEQITALKLKQPFGLDNIEATKIDDPGQPGAGEVRVRIKASSLNFHDFGVCLIYSNRRGAHSTVRWRGCD